MHYTQITAADGSQELNGTLEHYKFWQLNIIKGIIGLLWLSHNNFELAM